MTILIMIVNNASATSPWWDASRQLRLPVTIGTTGFERYDKPVEVSINFTQLINSMGQIGALDEDSVRVIETDQVGTIINTSVLFQFDKDTSFNAASDALGTIVFIMDGKTLTNTNRYYYIYFSLIGGSFSPISITPLVTITDNIIDEGMSSYKINNTNGAFYFQKDAGGFSSWNDTSGNDWISWNTASGDTGKYRGIPNAVYAKEIFHPGFVCCTTNIVSQGPIKIRIRSVNGTNWESIWDFYPSYATMIMTKANVSYGYWMLYEGTPGGKLEPSKDFMYRSNGVKTYLNISWNSDILNNEWGYISDPNVGRSLFIAHHEDDTLKDIYKSCCDPRNLQNNMTVFGFGRNESNLSGLIKVVQQHFTIGLIDGTDFTQNSKIINSSYKDLIITKGTAEKYDNTQIVETQITFDGVYKDRQPVWSLDGQQIAYVSQRSGSFGIYKMNIDGSSITMLNNSGSSLEPSWNPMNRILFSIAKKGFEDVYVMDNDGTNRTRLTNATDFDEYPDWSPDGSKIIWSSVNGIVNGTKHIWTMNADGTNKKQLEFTSGTKIQPKWSPDGTKIAFKSYASVANIWVMNSNGTNLKQLTFNTGSSDTHNPDWSPDSKKIVYASNKDGDFEIYTINADGTNVKQLTSNVGISDNFPAWSPNGRYIAFSSNRSGDEEIWTMDLNYVPPSVILSVISSSPMTDPITDLGVAQTFNVTFNKNASVTWFLDGSVVKSENGATTSNYINSTAGIGIHNINMTATDDTNAVSKEWNWTVQYIAPTMTLISPNGVENLTKGIVHAIQWNYTGNAGEYVNIELLKGDVLDGVINSNVPIGSGGAGRYDWSIPLSQIPGNDYKVRITSTSNSAYNDLSDQNFTIDVLPTISVISPNGGENWVAGTTNAITWTSTGNPGENVKIELLKGGIVNRTIISSTTNDGLHSWSILSGQADGNDYGIRITSTSNSAYVDASDNAFSIYGTTATKVNLKINITQGIGSVDVLRNDSGIWISLGATTATMTYTVIAGTQLNITATPDSGYNFEKWVTDKGVVLTTNPLVVYQKYTGSLNAYFIPT